jgi:hypothetical protein
VAQPGNRSWVFPFLNSSLPQSKRKKHMYHGLIQYINCSNYRYISTTQKLKKFFNGIASEFLASGVVLNRDRTLRFLAITLCCPQEAEVLSHLTSSFAKQTIHPNQQRKLQKIHKVL